MIKANCTRCEYDSCIYFKQCNDDLIYLLLYVDDMLIVARNQTRNQNLKTQEGVQRERFGRNQEDLTYGDQLGQEYRQTLAIPRELCSQDVGRFNMAEERPVPTSLTSHFRLSFNQYPQEEKDKISLVIYASAVRSLMYVMVCPRPDLPYAVSTISSFMSNLCK